MTLEKTPPSGRAIAKEKLDWMALEEDPLMQGEYPRKAEFERTKSHALHTLMTMQMALGTPDGYTILLNGAEKLREYYETITSIRGERGVCHVKATLGVPPDKALDSVLDSEIEMLTLPLGEKHAKEMNAYLASLVRAFGINAADTLKHDVPGNKFFMAGSGIIQVNVPAIDREEATLKKLLAECQGVPQLQPLQRRVEDFLVALQALKAVDLNPERIAHHDWYKETFAGKQMDWEPGRKIFAMLGTLASAMGLGQFIKSGQLSIATVGWAFATWLAATGGSVFKDAGNKAVGNLPTAALAEFRVPEEVENFRAIGTSETNSIVSAGFRGTDGAKAFVALQEIAKKNPELLKKLRTSKAELTIADLGALAESKDSPLFKILTNGSMNDAMQKHALTVFGAKFSGADRSLVETMIEKGPA